MRDNTNPSRREFLAAAAALFAGLSLPGRFARAEDLELKLGEPVVFPLHDKENRKLKKHSVKAAPHHPDILVYEEFAQNEPNPGENLIQLGKHVFLKITSQGETILDLETAVLTEENFKNFLDQEGCLPGGFVWQKHEKKLAGYISYRNPHANQNTLFYIEFKNGLGGKPEIKPLGSLEADNNFFYPEISSFDDLSLWDDTAKTITLMTSKGAVIHSPVNNRYQAQSKAVWSHANRKSSQTIAYIAVDKETDKRGILFYRPSNKGFKFQPINLGEKEFEFISNLAWGRNSDIYLESDSGLFVHQKNQTKLFDTGSFQEHCSPLIQHPEFDGIFYFKRQGPVNYSIYWAMPEKVAVLAKSNYVAGLSFNSLGKNLYSFGCDAESNYFLNSRPIK